MSRRFVTYETKDIEGNGGSTRVDRNGILLSHVIPDMREARSNNPSYIKNKPCCSEENYHYISKTIETPKLGVTEFINEDSSIKGMLLSSLTYDSLFDFRGFDYYELKFDILLASNKWMLNSIFPIYYKNSANTHERIDDKNGMFLYKGGALKNGDGMKLYFIFDTATLSEENKQKFTKKGCFLEFTNEKDLSCVKNIKLTCIANHKLDKSLCPTTTVFNGDKELILSSSTEGSSKQFKITVDDTGALTATEV